MSATGGVIKGSNYRQTNEVRALFFRRQISGLTLMAHRGDRGMSGERRLHQVEADDTFSK